MTNNEKRAAEWAEEIVRTDIIDDITPTILESLNAAQAEGYKQGAEKIMAAVNHAHAVIFNANDLFFYASAYSVAVDSFDMPKIYEMHGRYGSDGINAALSVIERLDVLPNYKTEKFLSAHKELEEGWNPMSQPKDAECYDFTPPQPAAQVEDDEREMRDAFEKWCRSREPLAGFDRDGIGYHDWDVDKHWKSWKAAWKEKSK